MSFRSLVFWNSLLNFKQGVSLVIRAFALLFPRFFGSHRIGGNPEKSDLVNFRGPD